MSEDFTRQDAIRVLGIAWNRATYKDGVGDLPSNGTQGDFAMEAADIWMERTPGLRLVLEAGVRALEGDEAFQSWLMTLYSGNYKGCLETERAIEGRFPPDPIVEEGMTADEIADVMIADLHERYGVPEADR